MKIIKKIVLGMGLCVVSCFAAEVSNNCAEDLSYTACDFQDAASYLKLQHANTCVKVKNVSANNRTGTYVVSDKTMYAIKNPNGDIFNSDSKSYTYIPISKGQKASSDSRDFVHRYFEREKLNKNSFYEVAN